MVRSRRIPSQGRTVHELAGSSPSDAVTASFSSARLVFRLHFENSWQLQLLASWPLCLMLRRQQPAYLSVHILRQCLLGSPSFAYIECSSLRYAVGQSNECEWGQGRDHCWAWSKSNYLRSMGIKMEKEVLKINLKIIANTRQRKH